MPCTSRVKLGAQPLYVARLVALSLCLCWAVVRPAGAGEPSLDRIVSWLEGEYSNQSQIAAGVLAAENDLLFPVFKRVHLPAFGSHVVYLQWPIGAPDGPLQRQRLWVFEHDDTDPPAGIRMKFFTLRQPERWHDAHIRPDKIAGMTPDDAIGYPAVCRLPVVVTAQQITASIPAACEIVSQRTQTAMTLQAEIVITRTQVTYREGGVRADGTDVFRVPAAGEYVFDRLSD
ncbi:MAG: CpcT/CpeT family chromophore lyase [Gammaproteobacteria bacterium]|nr:CpcT/CpeT family chromophore lyase [Gammaproteobacteria bacterium]